jgi:orotate phosphoribosyltransferase
LVIDDIYTTGSTARAAAQALAKAGAASVWVATLARASRVHDNRRNVPFRLDDAEDTVNPAGKSPVATLQGAGIYSLHEQSSF